MELGRRHWKVPAADKLRCSGEGRYSLVQVSGSEQEVRSLRAAKVLLLFRGHCKSMIFVTEVYGGETSNIYSGKDN